MWQFLKLLPFSSVHHACMKITSIHYAMAAIETNIDVILTIMV
jgi:hypothetical protein